MGSEQVFAVVAALLSGGTDPAFDQLRVGGYDSRYPVAVQSCELPPGTLEVEGQTLICGTVEVPENYDNPAGRRIALEFAILKARTQSAAHDPLVYLHGGPGAGTLQLLGPVSEVLFANHRSTRDVVTFDQRAAALSAATVNCYQYTADHIIDLVGVDRKTLPKATLDAMVSPCVEELLASDADLSAYNTANNARDVRAISQALGYPEYNIYGISYGTKLALEVMRSNPEGLRSVVLDGVAPPQVKLYDDLIGPFMDSLDVLVSQCNADPECAESYPDLQQKISDAFLRLAKEPVPSARGLPEVGIDALFHLVFEARNNWRDQKVITPYLPRIIHELAEGDSTTFDGLQAASPPDRIEALTATRGLTDDERALVRVALENAEAMDDLEAGVRASVERLKIDLKKDRLQTSVAEAFETRSNAAAAALNDEGARAAMLRDYALLQLQPPSRNALVAWIMDHFTGRDRSDLLALVRAMSADDVKRTFEIVDRQASKYEVVLGKVVNNRIFACQEDLPFNSVEGYEARVKALAERYPFASIFSGDHTFYETCAAFPTYARPGFHDPVSSETPVLALNGVLDIQTSWTWGELVIAGMPNGRNLVIPEAGHGTISYQPCANDISVAFINNPTGELDVTCIQRIKIDFLLPNEPLPF